jgi:hypothetical protein
VAFPFSCPSFAAARFTSVAPCFFIVHSPVGLIELIEIFYRQEDA